MIINNVVAFVAFVMFITAIVLLALAPYQITDEQEKNFNITGGVLVVPFIVFIVYRIYIGAIHPNKYTYKTMFTPIHPNFAKKPGKLDPHLLMKIGDKLKYYDPTAQAHIYNSHHGNL